MSFIALHRSEDASLGSTRYLLTADEVTTCESAVQMLARLQTLKDSRQAELEAATASAKARGYAAGREEALRSVAPQLLAAWEQAATREQEQALALRDAVLTLSHHVVQRLAAALAPQEVVAALALRAMEGLLPDHAITIKVHPDVAAAVRQHIATQGVQHPQPATAVEVRADPSLELLDCHLETPTGQLLAGLNTQLDNAMLSLRAANTRLCAEDIA